MAHVVNIKGSVISSSNQWMYDLMDIEATSPRKVLDTLDKAKGEPIEVHINSGGGEVFSGSEIYTALKSYKGSVTVHIVGIAASIASVIAMSGDRVLMSPTSQFMMHNVSSSTRGDYRAMNHSATVLKSANESIANAYRIKTRLGQDALLALMNEETWMSAEVALKHGFIDGILFNNDPISEAKAKLEMLKRK